MRRKLKLWMILAGLLLLSGCQLHEEKETLELFAMDTVMNVTVYGKQAKTAIQKASKRINRYDQMLDVTDPQSDLYQINANAGEYVTVNEETYQLIEKSLQISELTGGAFDCSIYPVVKAWGFTTEEYRIPDENERKELLQKVNYKKIHCKDGNQIMVEKGIQIDLGAIAKGYTSQKLMEEFRQEGVASAIVSLGGNVQVLGEKPDGQQYQVGIANPQTADTLIGTLPVKDCCVITSGSYERYFEKNGIQYHHIMDPKTAAPAKSDLLSVSVIGEDGTTCDGLSTALFVMGKQKALDFVKQHKEFQVVLVDQKGTVVSTTDSFQSE